MADLGGIQVAFDALQLHLDRHGRPTADAATMSGLTQEQRFFVAAATVWRAEIRDEALMTQLSVGPARTGGDTCDRNRCAIATRFTPPSPSVRRTPCICHPRSESLSGSEIRCSGRDSANCLQARCDGDPNRTPSCPVAGESLVLLAETPIPEKVVQLSSCYRDA